jgi:uncharacterized protein (DUF2236 family)
MQGVEIAGVSPAAPEADESRRRVSGAVPKIDFRNPAGAPALYSPDSVAWRVYKNPVSLFIGGVTAVLLELAEPRVRSGVWGHSIFPTDPLTRIRRTGMATHATIYAPRESAERLIRMVVRMHDRVEGETPDGVGYRANDVELLDWVQATVNYGFMEAYAAYASPLTDAERDAFYAESIVSARLFGAVGTPASLVDQTALFERMRPLLQDHAIIHEFLGIMTRIPALPPLLRPMQGMLLRASVAILPEWLSAEFRLPESWRLKPRERWLIRRLGALFERIPLRGAPPVEASLRLGLPAGYLYRPPQSGRSAP